MRILFLCVFLSHLFPVFVQATETDLGDEELIHLLHDQPMYFLLGSPETKIQLSFRAKVIKKSDLYLAYTQKIFWDLFQESRPFRDINYNPSIYYRFRFANDTDSFIDFIPYEHESNGKGGTGSRSWDRTGVRYQNAHIFENGMKGELSVRAWIPYNEDIQNPDFPQYRGTYEVIYTLSHFFEAFFDLDDLSLRIYPGGKSTINPLLGGRELTFRIKGKDAVFLANAVFQIFQGYGENMLEYKSSFWGLRLGIGI